MKQWLMMVLAVCVAPAAWSQGNALRIGVEGAYPPFSEIGTDGKLKGFDIDIAHALCERMKANCTLVQAEFDALIPGLRAKKIDAIVASMSITPERKKSVDFSDKYYQTPARMLARADAKFDVSKTGDAAALTHRCGAEIADDDDFAGRFENDVIKL